MLFLTVAAQRFDRRVYYNDNACAGTLTLAVSVWQAAIQCPANTPALNTVCETKSIGERKSSEGTGCTADKYSDTPYFPAASVAKLGSKYLVLNSYLPSLTCQNDGKQPMEQNSFLADGNCYAVETQNSFFKASCSSTTGQLDICSDAQCTKCGGTNLLNAGTFQSISLSLTQPCTNGIKFQCVDPSQTTNTTAPAPTQTQSKSSALNQLPSYLLALLL
ncbi:hypothetical protein EDD86DRAFT_208011 [Gorgonomyces haynaldii]|nr:hypothetical protein EDD86DRAFT_208011 [Gorgonomyces haynaldii]